MTEKKTKFITGLTKRERLFFVITAVLILSVLAYVFILEPLYTRWNQLGFELESSSLKLSKNLKLLVNKEILEKEYEKYKAYIQKEGDSGQEISSLLKEIEAIALSCGVKITSIKPKGQKEFKNYRKYDVELTSEANMNQFLKFIYEIESSKQLLKVERLVLSLKGTQTDTLKATFVIRKTSL